MRALRRALVLVLCCSALLGRAALADEAGIPAAGLVLRGSLGSEAIQMQLRPKPDNEGVEGDYFVFGQGRKILLAGEFDKGGFWMEESANGTDVSGQWEGERRGNVLSGTWRGADASDERPFILNVVKPAPVRHKAKP